MVVVAREAPHRIRLTPRRVSQTRTFRRAQSVGRAVLCPIRVQVLRKEDKILRELRRGVGTARCGSRLVRRVLLPRLQEEVPEVLVVAVAARAAEQAVAEQALPLQREPPIRRNPLPPSLYMMDSGPLEPRSRWRGVNWISTPKPARVCRHVPSHSR